MNKPYPSPVPDEFAGRRALVTGGSRGIGAAIAQRLLDGGASVVTSARSPNPDTPAGSTFLTGDIRSESGSELLVRQAREALGGLDILVNNAGAARVFPGAHAIPDEEWQDSLDINFLSAVRVTNAALPALRESNDAAIVNISSTAATVAGPPALHYAAAKAALVTYSKGMAKQLARESIRVNIVTPGTVETQGGTEVLQGILDLMGATMDAAVQQIPLGRRGDPIDIAEAVAYLVSDRAQWVAGANLWVDGGPV
jgi:NAD(P)-dependent dehydrogenase (short-subunit alcohol dehydrogenase family)